MLLLVPFSAAWINHDKIDIHAIYRRPRFKEDEYGEQQREYDAQGVATWDLTGPLPVKQHNKWLAKGFEYVTLSDRVSLQTAAMHGTIENWKQYDQHQTGGPWNFKKYAAGQSATTTREADQLAADVARFGSEAVEAIRQRSEPAFVLPNHLRNIQPAALVAPVSTEVAAAAADTPEPQPPKGKDGRFSKHKDEAA